MKTADELMKYFDVRTGGHKEFFHYTSLKAINAILGSKTIRISSADRFNDKKDKMQFGSLSEQKRYYSLCFSTGLNENLSLWYLYSGVDGKGGRISLTCKKLMKFINEGEFYLTEYDYEANKAVGIKTQLKNGDSMKLTLRDILYFRNENESESVNLKYNTMTNYGNVSIDEFEKYKNKSLGFTKSLIWYYEKESRLLIELIGDAVKLIEPNKDYAILWNLTDEQIKHMKIMCAPEIENISELCRYEHIKEFIFKTSRTNISENAGDIEMNICSKCDYEEKFCSKCKNKTGNNERIDENGKTNQ